MEIYDPRKNRLLQNQKPEGRKPDKKTPDETGGMSRRDFLKLGALALGGGTAAYAEKKYGWLGRLLGYGKRLAEERKSETLSEEENGETEEEFFCEEGDNYPDDLEAVTDKLKLHNWDPVKIDRDTSFKTEGYWYRTYKGARPGLQKSLEDGYLAMQPFVPRLRRIFEEEFRGLYPGGAAPEEIINLLYLALPESHWNWKEDSPKGAAGPYQFMPKTARDYGLKVETAFKKDRKGRKIPAGKIDERLDPLKSARAAAKCLKDLFKRTGDWELTLSGYNGGFIWKYLKEAAMEKEKPNYESFLKFIENKVNHYKKELPESNVWKHEIEKGWTFGGIAKFFRMEQKILFAANRDRVSMKKEKGKTVYKIKEQMKVLLVPVQTENEKRRVYNCLVAGFVENLNYPPKYNAVVKIIAEEEFQKKMEEKMRQRAVLARKK